MKLSINSAILFALVSIKSCQALALALEPEQAGLDRRDYDTIQYRHFWHVESEDEPEGIETYSLPKAIGWGCKNGNVTNFEGMVVDEVVTGIEEGCALWWEEEQCQGERHNFSFLLSSEHVSNVLFDHEYRKGARSYSYTQGGFIANGRNDATEYNDAVQPVNFQHSILAID